MKGKLYLIPNTLGDNKIENVIPINVQNISVELRYFIVENIKIARQYLRKIDVNFPIDETTFFELNEHTKIDDIYKFLKPAINGFSIGLISDAGCPAIADPGEEIVALAHKNNIKVVPLTGPSSIFLALMGSGFSAQTFTFHGYLPKNRKERIKKIKEFEANTIRTNFTHIFMDTPYRNMNVFDDIINELSDATLLCIAANITLNDEIISTMKISEWKKNKIDINKKPTIFLIGKSKI
jgi:16S rRNA (cytidine1402-2'-O)-methyltransferase